MADLDWVFSRIPEPSRTIDVTYMDGLEESYVGITRNATAEDVLHLYRREHPGDAEVHVVSLPLANVRKWVKT